MKHALSVVQALRENGPRFPRAFTRWAQLGALVVTCSMSPWTSWAATAPMAPVERLAMVDLQRVLTETKSGKAARAALEQSLKSKQQQLDKKRTQLEGEVAKLRNLKGQQLAAAQEKLQMESVEWQKTAMALEQELAQQEGKLLDSIYGNTQKIVQKIADEQKIDMVIVKDQMTVIYTEPNFDITDDVIRRYDKAHPK